jgi:hypothetical protein
VGELEDLSTTLRLVAAMLFSLTITNLVIMASGILAETTASELNRAGLMALVASKLNSLQSLKRMLTGFLLEAAARKVTSLVTASSLARWAPASTAVKKGKSQN